MEEAAAVEGAAVELPAVARLTSSLPRIRLTLRLNLAMPLGFSSGALAPDSWVDMMKVVVVVESQ